jgi:hypothetical protein
MTVHPSISNEPEFLRGEESQGLGKNVALFGIGSTYKPFDLSIMKHPDIPERKANENGLDQSSCEARTWRSS